MEIETRAHSSSELRADTDGGKLVGYAAVFNKRSLNLGGFVEVLERGAFAKSLADGSDIRALIDHRGIAIARTSNNTLRLREDDIGLRIEIDPPDTTAGRDIRKSVERGDVDQMSFGFTIREGGEEWAEDDDGVLIRTVSDVSLLEASIVTFPAYPDTSVAKRSVQAWLEDREQQTSLAKNAIKRRMSQKLSMKIRGLL